MKIEKVTDDKIKITLTVTDLRNQNIDIADLSLDTPKAHTFFDDILEQAFDAFGFEVNDSPVIIEASPISKDTLVIFISKVDKNSVFDKLRSHAELFESVEEKIQPKKPTRKKINKEPLLIYSSENLTNIELACNNLNSLFEGQSMLYKLKGKYYLVLGKNTLKGVTSAKLESILCETLSKVQSTKVSLAYLEEYGESLINMRTIELMSY
jgi:adapter protein MecA 1/2